MMYNKNSPAAIVNLEYPSTSISNFQGYAKQLSPSKINKLMCTGLGHPEINLTNNFLSTGGSGAMKNQRIHVYPQNDVVEFTHQESGTTRTAIFSYYGSYIIGQSNKDYGYNNPTNPAGCVNVLPYQDDHKSRFHLGGGSNAALTFGNGYSSIEHDVAYKLRLDQAEQWENGIWLGRWVYQGGVHYKYSENPSNAKDGNLNLALDVQHDFRVDFPQLLELDVQNAYGKGEALFDVDSTYLGDISVTLHCSNKLINKCSFKKDEFPMRVHMALNSGDVELTPDVAYDFSVVPGRNRGNVSIITDSLKMATPGERLETNLTFYFELASP